MVPRGFIFRWLAPAVFGLVAGFFALASAVTNETALPASLVLLFSPGLKVAELVMPETHASLAWTFGWFLRIAIGVNGVFYSTIFASLAYLLGRRGSRSA